MPDQLIEKLIELEKQGIFIFDCERDGTPPSVVAKMSEKEKKVTEAYFTKVQKENLEVGKIAYTRKRIIALKPDDVDLEAWKQAIKDVEKKGAEADR